MKNNILLIALLVLILGSSYVRSDERYCSFDNDKSVEIKPIILSGGDSIISLVFPHTERGALHRIDLRYGNPENYGNHEIYTQLGFQESSKGYKATIHLDSKHKPLSLVAIYHFEDCYSNILVSIKNNEVTIKNHRI